MPRLFSIPVTIPTGATGLSTAVFLQNGRLAKITMSSAWTAAALSFQVGMRQDTLKDFFKADGSEYSLVVAANHVVLVPPDDFAAVNWLILRSGLTGAAVNQAANRALILHLYK